MSILDPREAFKKFADEASFAQIVEMDSVSEMWNHSAQTYADNVAVCYANAEYTYARLDRDVCAFRTVLRKKGFMKGDRVALDCINSYDFVVAYLAAVTSGLVAAILPPQLDEMSVFGLSLKFGLKGYIFHDATKDKVVLAQNKRSDLFFVNISEVKDWDTIEPTASVRIHAKDPAVIMFTGGTTGKSKGALLSHGAVMQGTVNGCYGVRDIFNQKYILVLPLSHVFGLIRNLMTCLYTGSSIWICQNNKDMFRDIAVFKPTILVAVPALAEMALGLSRQFNKNMLGPDLKTIICGAALVPPYLTIEYKKLGIDLYPGYGLTESANLVSGNPITVAKPSSVGIPYPNQELKIVDGELWLKGKNLFDGYVGEEEENKNAFEDGWFKTGDLVRFDEDGYLYIVGRSKEIIVLSNGENVSPAEVETQFNTCELIQDSQVFEDYSNPKDKSSKHILALEVVPRAAEMAKIRDENKGKVLMDALQAINKKLPAPWQVSRIEIRTSDFERTPSMKIKRYHKC